MTIIEAGKEKYKAKETHTSCPNCGCRFLYKDSDIIDLSYLNCPWCDEKISSIDLFVRSHGLKSGEFIEMAKRIRDYTGCGIVTCKKALIKINTWDDNTFQDVVNYLRAGC